MNQTFNELMLEQHPDKTLIGRAERGFDFLGYYFNPDGLSVAWKTVERLMERVARLYEQGADSLRIGQYVSRWIGWVEGGFGMWEVDKKNAESVIALCVSYAITERGLNFSSVFSSANSCKT